MGSTPISGVNEVTSTMAKPAQGDRVRYIEDDIEQKGGREFLEDSDNWSLLDDGPMTERLVEKGVYIFVHDSEYLKATCFDDRDQLMVTLKGDLTKDRHPSSADRDDRVEYIESLIEESGGSDFLESCNRWERVTKEMHPKDIDIDVFDGVKTYRSISGHLLCRAHDTEDGEEFSVRLVTPFEHWDVD